MDWIKTNWRKAVGTAWLLAVAALLLQNSEGAHDVAVLVFVAGLAVLAVVKWADGIKPDQVAAPVIASLLSAGAVHMLPGPSDPAPGAQPAAAGAVASCDPAEDGPAPEPGG